MMTERLTFSAPEAAKILGISLGGVYAGIRRGEIPAVRIGGRVLIPREYIDKILKIGGEVPGNYVNHPIEI